MRLQSRMSGLKVLATNLKDRPMIISKFSKHPNHNKKLSISKLPQTSQRQPKSNPHTICPNAQLLSTPHLPWQKNLLQVFPIKLLLTESSMKNSQKKSKKVFKWASSKKRNKKMITSTKKRSFSSNMKKENLNIKSTGLLWKNKIFKWHTKLKKPKKKHSTKNISNFRNHSSLLNFSSKIQRPVTKSLKESFNQKHHVQKLWLKHFHSTKP
jgi:hypothetical protein